MSVVACLGWVWRRPFRVVVQGASMEPTLRAGDFLLAVRARRILRGSLVVVEHPGRPGHEMVKRVEGVPGDLVQGELLGEGRYWLMGDDPSGSTDSRSFGAVPERLVKGVVLARYWPPSAVTRFA
ncbi:MAG: S26 family signal peptidase [Actinomycetota bacterium]